MSSPHWSFRENQYALLGVTTPLNHQAEQNLSLAIALETAMERLDAKAELLRQKFARFKTEA